MPGRIIPTNGRVMLYHPCSAEKAQGVVVQHDPKQPLKCDVCHVWSEDMVNVVVTDSNGRQHMRTSVPIVQEGSPFTASAISSHCTWMDYQLGQAAKYEQLAGEQKPQGVEARANG